MITSVYFAIYIYLFIFVDTLARWTRQWLFCLRSRAQSLLVTLSICHIRTGHKDVCRSLGVRACVWFRTNDIKVIKVNPTADM